MRLAAHVGGCHDGTLAELPLNRERILLVVWADAGGRISRQTGDGQKGRPVHVRIWIAGSRVQRREIQGKPLAVIEPCGGGDKRILEERGSGTNVGASIRRIAGHHTRRTTLACREHPAETEPDAGLIGAAKQATSQAARSARRPCQAEPRRKIVPPGRRQCPSNSRGTWKHETLR